MAIAKITRQGLTTTAFLVACLWSCIVAQAHIVRTANRNLAINMVRLRQMRNGNPVIPVGRPLLPRQLSRPDAG
jgi:hypothetical protein